MDSILGVIVGLLCASVISPVVLLIIHLVNRRQ